MTLLGIDLRQMVTQRFAEERPEGTLVRVTLGAFNAGMNAGRVVTTTSHTCRAYRVELDASVVDNKTVKMEDCEIRVYRDTLKDSLGTDIEPSLKDRFILGSKTYEILHVGSDPATAMWVLRVRGP